MLHDPHCGARPWLVTTGAIAVGRRRRWAGRQPPRRRRRVGLGRTTIKEHPEPGISLVDLGVEATACETAALAPALTESDPDEELALRGDTPFRPPARRGDPAALPQRPPFEGIEQGMARRGRDARFARVPAAAGAAPNPAGAGEVQIDVEAASLNFRDVNARHGRDPGLEDDLSFGHGDLGSDCAGVVTAIGDAVRHLRVGDAVMGWPRGRWVDDDDG